MDYCSSPLKKELNVILSRSESYCAVGPPLNILPLWSQSASACTIQSSSVPLLFSTITTVVMRPGIWIRCPSHVSQRKWAASEFTREWWMRVPRHRWRSQSSIAEPLHVWLDAGALPKTSSSGDRWSFNRENSSQSYFMENIFISVHQPSWASRGQAS